MEWLKNVCDCRISYRRRCVDPIEMARSSLLKNLVLKVKMYAREVILKYCTMRINPHFGQQSHRCKSSVIK